MRKSVSRLFVFIFTFLIAWSMTIRPVNAGILDWLKAQFGAEEASTNMSTSLIQEGVSGEKHVTETSSNLMNVINLHVLGSEISDNPETALLREGIGPGLIGIVNSGIVALYTPPASSQTYVADLLQNAKIIPQAQAQGLGFAALDPILETWKSFRNVAYLFFVVIFLIIGFMIMFRTKLGQAAITVQQAIPNIIIAMLAVTFSYAIAGFLIDLMYLSMYMLTALFKEGSDLISGNIFTLVGTMFYRFGENVRNTMDSLMDGLLGSGMIAGALKWLSSLSAVVIIGLAILIGVFKIFFELLKSYIAIILQVVFAPIILMVGAIPGKNTFLSWIKNLVGNLIMWPLLLTCLLVNRMLTTGQYTESETQIGGFMPPFLIGTGQSAVFPALVAIGILLVIPEIMKEAKKKLGVEDGIMGSLAGSALKQAKQGLKLTKPALITGATVGGGLGGAGLGGALGFATSEGSVGDRFQKAKEWAGRGAAIGAAAPTVATHIPKFVKGTISSTIRQAEDAASERSIKWFTNRAEQRETIKEAGVEDKIAAEEKAQLNQKGGVRSRVRKYLPPNANSRTQGSPGQPPSPSKKTKAENMVG